MTIANLILALDGQFRQSAGQSLLITLLAAPLVYILINELVRYNARFQKLSGPWGLPVIGNLWDIRHDAAEKYRHWAEKYGDVYQIQLGNIPVIVINSAATAKAIISQNTQAMSSRPEFYTFHKVKHNLCQNCSV